MKRLRLRRIDRLALFGLAILAGILFVVTIKSWPAPRIDLQYGSTQIQISADRAWTLFPGDCVNLSWQLDGINTLHIDGEGKLGWGEMPFCPAINSVTSPRFDIASPNGIQRRLDLQIHHLPDVLVYLVSFVGLVGCFPVGAYFLWVRRPDRPLPVTLILTGALLLALVGFAFRVQAHSKPWIEEDNGDVAVRMWAEKDRLILPQECVEVGWSVAGAASLTVNGGNYNHSKELGLTEHCTRDGQRATLEAVAEDGTVYAYSLEIPSWIPEPPQRPWFFYWSLAGALLGAIVFLPIALRIIQARRRRKRRTDLLAAGGCMLLAVLLYWPADLRSSAHWEIWAVHAYFEGMSVPQLGPELFSRPLVIAPHALAYIIASESFLGYQLVNSASIAIKLPLLYGILRQLGLSAFYAFLATVLIMLFPVNSAAMSLRSFPMNFSTAALLAAVYLALEYRKNPTRLNLLGLWLSLLYNAFTNESGFVLILLTPLIWWLSDRRMSWRKINLTAIWCLVPVFKIAYLLLLFLTGHRLYGINQYTSGADALIATVDVLESFGHVIGWVYPHTLFDGWHEAFSALGRNPSWPLTVVALALVAGVSSYLARSRGGGGGGGSVKDPNLRQIGLSLLGGLLFIAPAVGVLMWFEKFRFDAWRMFFYAPIGAGLSLFSAALLLSLPVRRPLLRRLAIAAICMLLCIPLFSRLVVQHERYTTSAQNKAIILHQILKLAPRIETTTQIILLSEFDLLALKALGIHEFNRRGMFKSALTVLYDGAGPNHADICLYDFTCEHTNWERPIFASPAFEAHLGHSLFFKLDEDLRVELIQDPVTYLGYDAETPYDLGQLYDPDAPLPPRALSMLGAALRD